MNQKKTTEAAYTCRPEKRCYNQEGQKSCKKDCQNSFNNNTDDISHFRDYGWHTCRRRCNIRDELR